MTVRRPAKLSDADLLKAMAKKILKISKPFNQTIIQAGSTEKEKTVYNGKVLSDLDLYIISPTATFFVKKFKRIEHAFSKATGRDITVSVGNPFFYNKYKSYLRYEIQEAGRVLNSKNYIRGKKLKRSDIPRWEGISVVFTYLKHTMYRKVDPIEQMYWIAKTYMAMASAFINFEGKFQVSYKDREREFRKLDLSKDLKYKIQAAFDMKFNHKLTKKQIAILNDKSALRQTVKKYLNEMISGYIKQPDLSFEEKLNILEKSYPTRRYLNFIFYRNLKEFKPKLRSIINFSPIMLIKCVFEDDFTFLKKYISRLPKTKAEKYKVVTAYSPLVVKEDFF